jgi:hypothetical protein
MGFVTFILAAIITQAYDGWKKYHNF